MSTQTKSSRKERQSINERHGKPIKDASKGLKHSNSGDKKKRKDNKKDHLQRKEMGGKDPLKEAVFALGGDAEDYQLVKDVSEEDESGDEAAEEDVSIQPARHTLNRPH
jgi:hypothetical protein